MKFKKLMVSHGMVIHSLDERCKFCDKVRDELSELLEDNDCPWPAETAVDILNYFREKII